MSLPMRSPLFVTVDTGAVKLTGQVEVAASCIHPEHGDMLALMTEPETVVVAGTAEELTSFALDILSAVQVHQFEKRGSE